MPRHAQSDDEIERCFPVMAELRPHVPRDGFVELIRRMQQQGYHLAYLEQHGEVVAVAGYRIGTNLFMGKNLYVDDLVTAERHRSRGHGATLISWLRSIAKQQGCRYLHLDSGTQRHRAHKFYFEQGMNIASYHFSENLNPTAR